MSEEVSCRILNHLLVLCSFCVLFCKPHGSFLLQTSGQNGEERETGQCKTLPALAQPGMLSQQCALMESGSSFFVVFCTEIQNPPQASEKPWRRNNQRILSSPLEHHLNFSNKESQQLPIAKSYLRSCGNDVSGGKTGEGQQETLRAFNSMQVKHSWLYYRFILDQSSTYCKTQERQSPVGGNSLYCPYRSFFF